MGNLERLPTIHLSRGAAAEVDVDLSKFALRGGKVVMTLRRVGGEVVGEWEFDRSRVHRVVIGSELTAGMEVGRAFYKYDLMWHRDGERYAQCLPSPVEVSGSVGGAL